MAKVKINLDDLKGLAALAQRNGTTEVFARLALEWAESANAEIVRLRTALESIAAKTGSDDPCKHIVGFVRQALRGRK